MLCVISVCTTIITLERRTLKGGRYVMPYMPLLCATVTPHVPLNKGNCVLRAVMRAHAHTSSPLPPPYYDISHVFLVFQLISHRA